MSEYLRHADVVRHAREVLAGDIDPRARGALVGDLCANLDAAAEAFEYLAIAEMHVSDLTPMWNSLATIGLTPAVLTDAVVRYQLLAGRRPTTLVIDEKKLEQLPMRPISLAGMIVVGARVTGDAGRSWDVTR